MAAPVSSMRMFISLSLFVLSFPSSNGFVSVSSTDFTSKARLLSPLSASSTTGAATTLSESTLWNLRLVLASSRSGGPTIISMTGNFVEEEGYEPPQGTFRIIDDESTNVRIKSSRWMLSEDPDDRRDGLWVWGLFQEPLYPFLLLNLELEDIDTEEVVRFYAQVPHKRVEGSAELENAALTVRKVEQINADPMGFAKVDIADDVSVGRISFFPVVRKPGETE